MYLFQRAKIIQPVKTFAEFLNGPQTSASLVFANVKNKRMLMRDFDIDEYSNAHMIAFKLGQFMLEHRTKIMELYSLYTTLRQGWKIFGEWTDDCHEIEGLNTRDSQTRFSVFWSSRSKMYVYLDTDGYALFKTAQEVINFIRSRDISRLKPQDDFYRKREEGKRKFDKIFKAQIQSRQEILEKYNRDYLNVMAQNGIRIDIKKEDNVYNPLLGHMSNRNIFYLFFDNETRTYQFYEYTSEKSQEKPCTILAARTVDEIFHQIINHA